MFKRFLAAAIVALAPALAVAAPLSCGDQFQAGAAPRIENPKLNDRATSLCFSGFATRYSGLTRTPLYSAEHLTRERIEAAREMRRKNAFHAELRLPAADRSELTDYARSGYDRGHLAPSGDMPTSRAQHDSFSLANMVPQNPNNNRHLWEGIESITRTLAERDGELYVVSGPIFRGATLERLHGRVLVPSGLFKAIYDPRRGAAAYVAENAPGMNWRAVSIDELRGLIGMDVFPALPAGVKARAMSLPEPTPYGASGRRNSDAEHQAVH